MELSGLQPKTGLETPIHDAADNFVSFPTVHDGTAGYLFHNGLLSVDDASVPNAAFGQYFSNWVGLNPTFEPLE